MQRLIASSHKRIVGKLVLFLVVGVYSPGRAADPTVQPHDIYVTPKHYVCYRATKPINIDGKLDDAAWSEAPWTDDFVDIEGDKKPRPKWRTRLKMLWDDNYLYIGAELQEPHVWGTLVKPDSVIFNDNDFEVFIDPDGDSHRYGEFEINALNTGWDLFLPKPYKDGGPADNSWDIAGLKTAIHVDGTLNNPKDEDRGWFVEMALPFKALAHLTDSFDSQPGRPAMSPPRDGDRWRINFSRVEWLHEIVDGKYRKVPNRPENNWVWSPQWTIDMHRPEMWGYLQFTRQPPTKVTPIVDTAGAAVHALHKVYYAQSAHKTRTESYANSLEELELAKLADAALGGLVTLQKTGDGYVASVDVRVEGEWPHRWSIRQDGRVWGEPIPLPLTEALVVPPVGRYGRSVVQVDALEHLRLGGNWKSPSEGDMITLPDGATRAWERVTAGADGWIAHQALGGGYAYLSAPAAAPAIRILEAAGHGMVYANGEPRAGDLYSHGYMHVPVALRGTDDAFLFHVGRGRLHAQLVPPRSSVQFDLADTTLPDLIVGSDQELLGAVLLLNASTEVMSELSIESTLEGRTPKLTPVPPLIPLSTRKVGFVLAGSPAEGSENQRVMLRLIKGNGDTPEVLDRQTFSLRVRKPDQSHRRTFRSEIDGSVQYFAVVPAQTTATDPAATDPAKSRPGLILTLHGAGVEGQGQADAYLGKSWASVVAPTNRRPFGFDWEDWGRLDAMEVLRLAKEQLNPDPQRIWLTGHSMGGHGAWQVGVHFPDQFAAIGPSAGWVSMFSYAGATRPESPDPIQEIITRSMSASDTLAVARNLANYGVYILHGAGDDNVPVGQARSMRQQLAGFHSDFAYYEEPGAGHWWGKAGIPGTACVDWPPMWDFFQRHTLPKPEDVREVNFITASPSVSATSHWVTIQAQQSQWKPSSVSLKLDTEKRRVQGTTDNVAHVSMDLARQLPAGSVQVELDGKTLESDSLVFHAQQTDGEWSLLKSPDAYHKNARRYGAFKDVFRNHVMFVYGTTGSEQENAWSFAKARYDAEQFWYRGNGSIDVVADRDFNANKEPDRNVVIYGNSETNSAWKLLLAKSPVQIQRKKVTLGDRTFEEDHLACLFLCPRPGSDIACVGVIGGSGVKGMQLTNRIPYFVSGVGIPDCLVFGPEIYIDGTKGISVAGFFGLDWSVERGEFRFRDNKDP